MEKLVDCDTVSNIFFRLLFMPSDSSSGSSQLLQYYKILEFVDSEFVRPEGQGTPTYEAPGVRRTLVPLGMFNLKRSIAGAFAT